MESLVTIGGVDSYEIPRNEWQDVYLDLWPSITWIHLELYLLLTGSPYKGNKLMNYKSIHCYKFSCLVRSGKCW